MGQQQTHQGAKTLTTGARIQDGGFEGVTIKLRLEASNFSERERRALPGVAVGAYAKALRQQKAQGIQEQRPQ